MKRRYLLVTLLSIVTLMFAACQQQAVQPAPAADTEMEEEAAPAAETQDEMTEATSDEPKHGGTLTVAVPSIVHLDVAGVNQFGLNEVAQLFYETLVDRVSGGEIVPLLIQEWEISPDGLVHTWHLQPDVTFHDGSEFNAEVVKWNLDRKINNQGPMWDMIPFEQIEVVDPLTVEVTLSRPYPGIYNVLAVKTFSMYSPSFVEEVGEDGLKSQAVGTGPFIVEEYVPNEVLRLTKNPDYWQEGLPYLDAVNFQVVPDNNTRATMLEAGDADIAVRLALQDIQRFEENPNDGVKVLKGPSSRHYYMSLTNIHPPLDDVRVRLAINHAVDKQGIADAVYRGFVDLAKAHIITPAVEGYHAAGVYEYDPEKAKQLLEEAGWVDSNGDGVREKDGEELVLQLRTRKGATPGDIDTAELVQGMLREVGIQADIDIVDTATFLAEINQPIEDSPHYDMVNLTWGTFTGDAEYVMKTYYSCDAWPPRYWDYSHYCSEEVDQYINEADAAPTLEDRNALYAQAIEKFWEDAPNLLLFVGLSTVATQEYVEGLYLDPAQTIWPAKYAWLDK